MNSRNQQDMVLLFDVDNTLLDNDYFLRDFSACLERELGVALAARYWAISAARRQRLGYVDYLGTLQELRLEYVNDQRVLQISTFVLDYPFAERLYARVPAVLQHCRQWGETVILSDGDGVFQPFKIRRAGLSAAVENRLLIYVHKELMFDQVEHRYPARHYVMIDDKLNILTALKQLLGVRVTTVFPRQGHYALDPHNNAIYPPADVTLDDIGDLLRYDKDALLSAAIR
jgi:FMN phosphatase YigB (HAD superfamily)